MKQKTIEIAPGVLMLTAVADDGTLPNYIVKLKSMLLNRQIKITPGTVNNIMYYHDDWCESLKGGLCRCDPNIELRR